MSDILSPKTLIPKLNVNGGGGISSLYAKLPLCLHSDYSSQHLLSDKQLEESNTATRCLHDGLQIKTEIISEWGGGLSHSVRSLHRQQFENKRGELT